MNVTDVTDTVLCGPAEGGVMVLGGMVLGDDVGAEVLTRAPDASDGPGGAGVPEVIGASDVTCGDGLDDVEALHDVTAHAAAPATAQLTPT